MQYTPKKKQSLSVSVRYNPYASGGRDYLGQYKQHINEKSSSSTPRKKVFKSFTPHSCKRSLIPHLKKTTAALTDDRIKLELSSNDYSTNNDSSTEDLASNLTDDASGDEIDPLRAVTIMKPRVIYSMAKHKSLSISVPKDDEFDKENSIAKDTISNSFYRKEVTPKRSSILCDISPKTIKNAYPLEYNSSNVGISSLKEYKFRRLDDKKNVETEPAPSNSEPEYPHMIGFPNYGNTCYLNSVLQSLMGLLPFIIDLSNIQNMINLSNKSITRSLFELISGRQKCNGTDVKRALRFLKENIERVDEAFAGFKMQDANEFLTQILDSIKDEIDHCMESDIPSNSCENTPNKENTSSIQDEQQDSQVLEHSIFSVSSEDSIKSEDIDITIMPVPETSTPQSTVINPVIQNFGFELLETYECLGCGEVEVRAQEYFALYVNLPKEESILDVQKSVEASLSKDERELTCDKCGHNIASVITRFTKLPRILIIQLKRYEYNQEQFECIKVSAKVDLNMWLYLGNFAANAVDTAPSWTPQPLVVSNYLNSKETELEANAIGVNNDTQIDTTAESSHSTEDIPEVTLDDLQLMPFSEDSLCNKEEENYQMAINLSMQTNRKCYSTDDTSDKASSEAFSEDYENAYRLLSVISHFGQTTSTGHYVADVWNCQESQWYHYDDETVAKLQETVLLAEGRQKNAYIYFYVDKNLYEDLGKTTTSL